MPLPGFWKPLQIHHPFSFSVFLGTSSSTKWFKITGLSFKRQDITQVFGGQASTSHKRKFQQPINFNRVFIIFPCEIYSIPVSYTHLDVYKRQIQMCVYLVRIFEICIDNNHTEVPQTQSYSGTRGSWTIVYEDHWACLLYTSRCV